MTSLRNLYLRWYAKIGYLVPTLFMSLVLTVGMTGCSWDKSLARAEKIKLETDQAIVIAEKRSKDLDAALAAARAIAAATNSAEVAKGVKIAEEAKAAADAVLVGLKATSDAAGVAISDAKAARAAGSSGWDLIVTLLTGVLGGRYGGKGLAGLVGLVSKKKKTE